MEQYNKNNLKNVQVIRTENKKMTKIEQRQIKLFFQSLNPKILNNPKTFYYVLIEHTKRISGLGFNLYIINRKRFYQLLIDFLSYLQNTEPIKYNKENHSYTINKFRIEEIN